MRILIIVTLLFSQHALSKPIATGTSMGHKFQVNLLVEKFGVPWGFDFLDPNTMIITEKSGKIRLLDLKTKKLNEISGAPKVDDNGQGGLLDIRKHPKFPKVPWIYITYSEPTKSGARTTLARFQIKGKKLIKFEKLLATRSVTSTNRHFGSRIVFDNSGYLYFSVGDRGHRPNGQDLNTHAGSIMRLHDDGRIPKDNPFVNQKGKQAAIWSYGHRNPQGLSYDKTTDTLWAIEHGPRGGDELNLVQKGKNYGWPTISYGKEYWGPIAVGEGTHRKGMEQPVHYYVPSIAPCGMTIYSGRLFPNWRGNLFAGALKLTHMNQIIIANRKYLKEVRLLDDLGMRIRNIQEGPDGKLYFSADRGQILVLEPLG